MDPVGRAVPQRVDEVLEEALHLHLCDIVERLWFIVIVGGGFTFFLARQGCGWGLVGWVVLDVHVYIHFETYTHTFNIMYINKYNIIYRKTHKLTVGYFLYRKPMKVARALKCGASLGRPGCSLGRASAQR